MEIITGLLELILHRAIQTPFLSAWNSTYNLKSNTVQNHIKAHQNPEHCAIKLGQKSGSQHRVHIFPLSIFHCPLEV